MDKIRAALSADKTIDIVTTGAKSGLPRTTEIWFTRVGTRIIICGTPGAPRADGPPGRRDWLANLKVNPDFTFVLKASVSAQLPATATLIVDPQDRRLIMSAPETRWYRDQVESVEDLVEGSPIVEVFFKNVGFNA